MAQLKYHPGELCSVWYDLPVSGICIDTGARINFKWKDIHWDTEGIVDDGILVSVYQEGTRQEPPCQKQFHVYETSLTLVFPESLGQRTPLQNVALSALQFAHWRPAGEPPAV